MCPVSQQIPTIPAPPDTPAEGSRTPSAWRVQSVDRAVLLLRAVFVEVVLRRPLLVYEKGH